MSDAARRAALVALATALPALFTACSGSREGAGQATPAAPTATPAPTPYDPRHDPLVNPTTMFEPAPADPALMAGDETLYRVLDGNPASLNPIFFTSMVEAYVTTPLYDNLFVWDPKFNWRVFEPTVESFEESADHLTYTVTLKPGLKWHDGHPFTAEDVCYSWKEILDERVPCPAVRSGTEDVKDCKVLSERTLRMTHKEALPTSKWNVAFPIIPKHIWSKDKKANPDLKTGEYYSKLHRAPIGSGPYKFVEWIENDKIVMERWDEYPGPRPHFKRIVFRIIPDRNVQLLSFNKGDIDEMRLDAKQFATQTLAGSDFAKIGVKALAPAWDYTFIVWNADGSNPFFNDPKVRRAMTLSCDIERMIRDLAFNLYQAARGMWHPDSWMFNPEVKRLPFDLSQAGQLLDEAGWKVDASKEGWRYKDIDGQPVKLQFTLLIPQGAQISIDLAAIFQEDLKSIGVQMDTQVIEWATFSQRNRQHQFQASILAWGTGVDPDTQRNIWLSDQYDKAGNFGRNYGGYNNPRVDELFKAGQREFDADKRKAIYQEIQKLVYDDQPYTFLWHRAAFWAVHNHIRGVTMGPRGLFGFYPGEFGWWMPAGSKNPVESK